MGVDKKSLGKCEKVTNLKNGMEKAVCNYSKRLTFF
jgi:hypothetical protein